MLLILLIQIGSFLSSVSPVFAAKQFSISQSSRFEYSADGTGTATHEFSVTNLTSENYLTSLQVNIHGFPISNPKAKGKSDLLVKTTPTDNGTQLTISGFKSPAVGKHSVANFSLTYDLPQAIHTGETWQVTIPKLTSSEIYDRYTTSVLFPKAWGYLQDSLIEPSVINENFTPTHGKISFTKISNYGFSNTLTFGNLKQYSFTLTYDKPRFSPFYLLLPPDTPLQRVSFESPNFPIFNITRSQSGNYMAQINEKFQGNVVITGQFYSFKQPVQSLWLNQNIDSNQFTYSNNIITHIKELNLDTNYLLPKSIQIVEKEFQPIGNSNIQISLNIPKFYFPILESQSSLILTNSSGVAKYYSKISLDAHVFENVLVPPFGTVSFPIKMPYFAQAQELITPEHQVTYNIPITRYLLWYALLTIITISTFFGIGIIASKAWSILFQKHFR